MVVSDSLLPTVFEPLDQAVEVVSERGNGGE